MALVGGHRLRVQIASAALVPLVAASAGISKDDSAAASIPDTPSVAAVTAGKAQVSMVGFSSEAVRAFQVSHDPEPDDAAVRKAVKAATDPGRKVLYLTFDDGPSAAHTKPILDLLDDHGAKATFFLVGENAVAHPALARSVVARGHAVGNHTWNHRDMRRLSSPRLNHQITRTSNVLRQITGQPITCLRPPYGAANGRVKATVRARNLAMTMWDIDPRDWKRPGAHGIARKVVANAARGAVILMHDGGGNRSQSVRALRRILHTLSEKGYAFKTLPGC